MGKILDFAKKNVARIFILIFLIYSIIVVAITITTLQKTKFDSLSDCITKFIIYNIIGLIIGIPALLIIIFLFILDIVHIKNWEQLTQKIFSMFLKFSLFICIFMFIFGVWIMADKPCTKQFNESILKTDIDIYGTSLEILFLYSIGVCLSAGILIFNFQRDRKKNKTGQLTIDNPASI